MLEGSPLQYYPVSFSQFQYFNRFDHTITNMSEDLMMPPSPHSVQSDSDNSISSIEIPSKNLRAPIFKGNNKQEVQCRWKNCGVIFDSLDQLSSHVSQVHSSSGVGGLFYCGWEGCTRNNKGFNARYKMLVHVRTHTNEKPHQCCQCEKSFSRAENLKIHSRSHSGEKPYVCPVPGCKKAYSNSSDRFKHTRTHQVEKPYQCKIPGCTKRYTDPSSLRKHVKTYKHLTNTTSIDNIVINDDKFKKITLDGSTNENNGEKRDYFCISENEKCQNMINNLTICKEDCCCPKTNELLNINAFINFSRVDVKPMQWNRIIDAENLFMPYDLTKKHIDVDLPLDLSISRKHL